jgi:hypothetical protein
MATPHVSGVAALVWSCDPSATNVEVRNALTSTALDLGTTGRDDYYGFGLIQAWEACQSISPSSVELLSFTAKTTQDSVILKWKTASEVNIVGFNLYRSEGVDGERIQINDSLIPSKEPQGSDIAVYDNEDTGVNFGVDYFYWLEAVDNDMQPRNISGPVAALWWKIYIPLLVR